MDIRYERQLKRGVLEIVVLKVISQGQTYGYELISKLERESGGLFKLKEGTLYPILYRLEDDALIKSEWSAPSGRSISKKYYAITAEGKEALQELIGLWGQFSGCVNQILQKGDITHDA